MSVFPSILLQRKVIAGF